MKRYLFLKLGLTILVFAAASPRSQNSDHSGHRESRKVSNTNQNQNVEVTTIPSSQRGDTNTNIPDYQGVMGKPGVDFPVLKFIPRTKFTCRGKKSGYYADLETNCQVFHICDEGRKVSFLCPNGTIFQQSDLICDWWFKVDCAISPTLYEESAEQLREDNVRRKENRKVQQQQQPQQERRPFIKQQQSSKEYTKQRKPYQQNYQQNNFAKKDINQYTSNPSSSSSRDESQIVSETASFVNNRYTSEHNQKYYKSVHYNDVTEDTQTVVPPKSYVSGDFSSTEKINNRGGRTFNNNKIQYRNQVPDHVKTTTQHTIYSPTVPPFTTTIRYTTKVPAAFSTTTEQRLKSNKPVTGFFITKDFSTPSPDSQKIEYSTQKLVGPNARQLYTPSPFTASSTADPNELEIETFHTTRAAVSKPLAGSNIITSNRNGFDQTTTETSFPETTHIPSVPTPFKTRMETLKDSSSTNRFNQYTYLPKSTVDPKNDKLPTPKPTLPTEYTTLPTSSISTNDHINGMLKTLEEIEGEDPLNLDNDGTNSRPGLHIPPSAGPKTLHSLAIYFATALDNLAGANETGANGTERTLSTISDEETHLTTLLSRMTQEKYNSLFDENQIEHNQTEENSAQTTTPSGNLDLQSLVDSDAQLNDLDGQQSRGPVSSSTPRIRQLAQVFTQALSAYLDDPDTFKKVLEEIRPTEPPLLANFTENLTATTSASPTTTDYKSYTKEEDEVLDFSDADKSSTYKPYIDNNIRTTLASLYVRSSTPPTFLNEISSSNSINKDNLVKNIPTPNPLALDLNNRLKLSTPSGLQDIEEETSIENNTESDDYFPFNTGDDEEAAKRRATAKPYGLGVKPQNSTPISIPPNESLLPPFKISLLNRSPNTNNSYYTQNEEYLQSAHSQSFVGHNSNKIPGSDRNSKALSFNFTADITTTDFSNQYTTTSFDYYYTTTTEQPTASYNEGTTDFYYTTTENYYPSTTNNDFTTESTATTTHYDTTTVPTTEQTTFSKAIPNDHWSTSPEVTKLWETTLYVNPLIINRNLAANSRDVDPPTTYRPEFPTQPYRQSPTTTNDYSENDEIDLKFTSTTTDGAADFDFATTTVPTTTEFYSTVVDLGIHNLLNSTELEIANTQARQIFGNLKSSEQDLLIEKMKQAESNSTVRRLILLLVSTCDANLSNNKTVQETRNSILNALLNTPNDVNVETKLSSRAGKQLRNFDATTTSTTTTTSIPETTSIRVNEKSRKITAIRSSIETPSKVANVNDVHQDTRALELLRSLYSLAAKWGKK